MSSNTKGVYWYMYVYEECPLCGHMNRYKYRVYGHKKPERREDRMTYLYISFCGCDL